MNILDGSPVSWSVGGLGETLDASSGDLVLTPGTLGAGAFVVSPTYSDVSIRTQMNVSHSSFIDAGVFARLGSEGEEFYAASITGSEVGGPRSLWIYSKDENLASVPTVLDPTETDVFLQFDILGDRLSLTAWAADTSKPSDPQLSVQDNRLEQGIIGVFIDNGTIPTSATFRFFAAAPEPSTLGDVNFDGLVNGLDVDPFVDVLLNGLFQAEADMNEDGEVNGLDVDPFVADVVGGVQQVPEPTTLLLTIVALSVVGGWRKWRR
jgi:hypothetical protein